MFFTTIASQTTIVLTSVIAFPPQMKIALGIIVAILLGLISMFACVQNQYWMCACFGHHWWCQLGCGVCGDDSFKMYVLPTPPNLISTPGLYMRMLSIDVVFLQLFSALFWWRFGNETSVQIPIGVVFTTDNCNLQYNLMFCVFWAVCLRCICLLPFRFIQHASNLRHMFDQYLLRLILKLLS